jgi:hypothetical protein
MSNSFYYFFSATPQVLAAILALFEAIKKQLLGMGQYLWDEGNMLIRPPSMVKLSNQKSNEFILSNIKKAISRIDIEGLRNIIDLIDYETFQVVKERYESVYKFLEALKRQTIYWSILTAAIIIFCLAMIPFSECLIKPNCILNSLFGFTIICIIACFLGLILILRKSLKEIRFSEFYH